jgi:transposase
MLSKDDLQQFTKEELVDFTYNLLKQIENLTREVQFLREEVRLNKNLKNSGNSSLPPSKDLFQSKNQSLREKSNKKSGGQPGHKGETLLMTPNPDKIIKHAPSQVCPKCGEIHTDESLKLVGKRQVIDTPVIMASVIEHQIYQSTCKCGFIDSGTFPVNVAAPVQYGPNLISLTAYLSSRQFVPYHRLTELIQSITNISMSEGTISNILNKAADSVLPLYEGIKNEVANATTIGGDETGLKVKNAKYWAWTWQTALATYISISKSRGFETVTNTFPDGFPNATYVSDSLSAQLKIKAKSHQLCLAHLLRDLTFFQQIYLHSWPTKMKALLKRAILLKHSMTPEQYTEPFGERAELIKAFDTLLKQTLPGNVPKIFPFQKRLIKRHHQIFTFLFYPGVPYDNNGSERAIRNIKVKQKVSGGFRSERGAEIFAILRSVFDTVLKKGGNPFEDIRFALNMASCKSDFRLNQLL